MDTAATHFQLGPGWAAFTSTDLYVRFALILIAATASGLVLAYHPAHRRRPLAISDLDQRRTLIIYGVVGALIALICSVSPSMAFVIFGIGGLMRFRTDVGASKDTGHTIVVTLIGLCWGLGMELVAVVATVFFWLMIFAFEWAPYRELKVGGVAIVDMARASEAYHSAIQKIGGRVLGHAKDFKKGQMTFVVRLPAPDSEEAFAREVEAIPEALRGTPDWRS
jgi:hypothetical protein